jgi:hypothetical protein
MMPDNSLAFVVVQNPAKLFQKATTLAQQIEAPMPDPMELLQERLPAAQHIDMARPAAVVFHPDGAPVGGILLMPVTDFEAFVNACGAEDANADLVQVDFVGNSMVAASYKKYAVLTDASGASGIEAVKNSESKVAAEFAAMRQRMEAADITGGATRSGIEAFAVLAKQGIAALQIRIEAGDDEVPGMPPKSISEAMSMYSLLVDEFEAAVQNYAFAVNIDTKMVTGEDIFRLKTGDLATKLEQIEPSGTDWSGQLPAGLPVFVMAGTTPSSLMPGVLEFSKKMMLAMSGIYGMDEDQIHQLIEDSKPLMAKTRSMAFLMAVPRREKASLYAGAGGILKVDTPAEQYIDDYTELITKMDQAMKNRSGQALFRFATPKKIKIDGKAGVRIIAEISFPGGTEDSAERQQFNEMMAKIYGPDGKLKIFLVAANQDTVVFGYTSQATVKRYMAAASGELPRTLGSMPAYKTLVSHQPDGTLWKGAIDLGGYFKLIQRFLPPGTIPDVEVRACPIGFAVTASEQEIGVHSAVTVHTIKRIVQAAMQVARAGSGQEEVEP